jgi:hypothetical protein
MGGQNEEGRKKKMTGRQEEWEVKTKKEKRKNDSRQED